MAQKDCSKIQKALKKKGFVEEKDRDHNFYFLDCKKTVFTKISHGSSYKTYGDDLLGKVSRQLKLSNKELLDLIDCPLDKSKYLSKLKEKKII